MPFQRKRNALQFTEAELRKLESIGKSRTEEKRRTVRAALLLDSLSGQSDETIAQNHHISRSTVLLSRSASNSVWIAALEELPRAGKPRQSSWRSLKRGVLNGVPFGSASRVMCNGESQTERIGQLRLEFGFPGAATSAIAAAGVAQNEELAGSVDNGPHPLGATSVRWHGQQRRLASRSYAVRDWAVCLVRS
jgi:hypothetical protein